MNASFVKFLSFTLILVLAGCAATKTTLNASTSAVAPQDSPNTDFWHDGTGYKSSFSREARRKIPMLFIVGDSTVHNYNGGRVGWGDVIGNYFDTNKILVENHALAGRSSRTFITQGWWDLLLKEAQRGDFLLLQMGHNDAGAIDDTNRARGTIQGIGDEQKKIFNPVTQKNEIVHAYGWYLRKYISDAREKGLTPIICSPVPHLPKTEVKAGEIENSDYVHFSGEVATNENAAFINLNQLVVARFAGMTVEQIKTSYFVAGDNTHFNLAGAQLNASCVVAGLNALKNCPLKNYFRPPPK